MAFPILSRRPIKEHVEFVENMISSQMASGHIARRRRYTRDRRKWKLTYDMLSLADYTLIYNHYTTVGAYSMFTFVDKGGTSRNVYYDKPISWAEPFENWYKVATIELVEY